LGKERFRTLCPKVSEEMEKREYTQEELMQLVETMPENMIITVELEVDEDD